MGELSKPIMTPLGVLYRSYFDNESQALKSSEWAVKIFGGTTTAFSMIGPGRKGYYEAAIMATVPTDAKNVKPQKNAVADVEWHSTPEHAYVLFDALETPAALAFYKRDLLLRPGVSPPLTAFWVFPVEQ